MKKAIFLLLMLNCTVACSSKTFWDNTEKTQGFFSENLIFFRPEEPLKNKHRVAGNIATLQAAQTKRQEISYDPYYPMPKPWSEKPEATHLFNH